MGTGEKKGDAQKGEQMKGTSICHPMVMILYMSTQGYSKRYDRPICYNKQEA